MSSRYFASTDQSEAHQASVIVYFGDDWARPNLLIGVAPNVVDDCESCGEPMHPLRTVTFDMDDTIAEAFELAVAQWREIQR